MIVTNVEMGSIQKQKTDIEWREAVSNHPINVHASSLCLAHKHPQKGLLLMNMPTLSKYKYVPVQLFETFHFLQNQTQVKFQLKLLLLLAPSGALVVIMVYYIPSNPLFQIFQILQILK